MGFRRFGFLSFCRYLNLWTATVLAVCESIVTLRQPEGQCMYSKPYIEWFMNSLYEGIKDTLPCLFLYRGVDLKRNISLV